MVAIYSCMSLPMYSLVIANVNDFLQPNEIVSASAAIAILVGIGSILVQFLHLLMSIAGADGFYFLIYYSYFTRFIWNL